MILVSSRVHRGFIIISIVYVVLIEPKSNMMNLYFNEMVIMSFFDLNIVGKVVFALLKEQL